MARGDGSSQTRYRGCFLENKEAQRVKLLQQRSQREEKSSALKDFTFVSDRLRDFYDQQEKETNRRIKKDDLEEEITILRAKNQKLAKHCSVSSLMLIMSNFGLLSYYLSLLVDRVLVLVSVLNTTDVPLTTHKRLPFKPVEMWSA